MSQTRKMVYGFKKIDTILRKLKKVFLVTENVFGLTMIFDRTKHWKIGKKFSSKYFTSKQKPNAPFVSM